MTFDEAVSEARRLLYGEPWNQREPASFVAPSAVFDVIESHFQDMQGFSKRLPDEDPPLHPANDHILFKGVRMYRGE